MAAGLGVRYPLTMQEISARPRLAPGLANLIAITRRPRNAVSQISALPSQNADASLHRSSGQAGLADRNSSADPGCRADGVGAVKVRRDAGDVNRARNSDQADSARPGGAADDVM